MWGYPLNEDITLNIIRFLDLAALLSFSRVSPFVVPLLDPEIELAFGTAPSGMPTLVSAQPFFLVVLDQCCGRTPIPGAYLDHS